MTSKGPLSGIRIVEMAGIGPAPLAAQMLADLGADVISIDRKSGKQDPTDVLRRNKRSVALNLKDPAGVDAARRLIATADILIEGFRPGVMEKLGLGPVDCHGDNPGLIYGRMTGWGQSGPMSHQAGHDLNYISLSGALDSIGLREGPPIPPLNFVGDYGGGTMFLIFGVLAAMVERQTSGKGQVVDAAMVDGVPAMMSIFYMMLAQGQLSGKRQDNMLDGGAHFYRCYETKDGKAISVGPIEPQFYAELCEIAGLPHVGPAEQMNREIWESTAKEFAAVFATKTRDEWADIFADSDACVAPVLTMEEAEHHRHNAERGSIYRSEYGILQAAPAPRFDRTPAATPSAPGAPGADTKTVLADIGLTADEIANMEKSGAIT